MMMMIKMIITMMSDILIIIDQYHKQIAKNIEDIKNK